MSGATCLYPAAWEEEEEEEEEEEGHWLAHSSICPFALNAVSIIIIVVVVCWGPPYCTYVRTVHIIVVVVVAEVAAVLSLSTRGV